MANLFVKATLSVALVSVSFGAFAESIADQLVRADVQLELSQKQKQIEDTLSSDAIMNQLPRVVSVMQFGAQKSVRLLMPSGAVQTFGPGDEITKRMRVGDIGSRRVSVVITPLPSARAKGPVTVPIDFVARAQPPSGGMGMGGGMVAGLGTPGQATGPIPIELRQAPPAMPYQGAIPWNGAGLRGASPAPAQQAAPAAPVQ